MHEYNKLAPNYYLVAAPDSFDTVSRGQDPPGGEDDASTAT